PDSILVRLADGSRKAARLLATDHSRKLVLLKIETDGKTDLLVPTFAERKSIRAGQWAIAVGRIFPGKRPNISVGIVSAVNRIWGKAIQTDAAVSPNNYGGPLIDIHGRVMGVLVPMSPEGDSQIAGFQWYDSGIGFAIPADDVLRSVELMKRGEDLYGGFLGVGFKQPNLSMAEAIVAGCAAGSPAQKAGLRTGDRIVAIDGRQVGRAAELREAVARRYAGEKMKITVERDGREIPFEIELSAPPKEDSLPKKVRLKLPGGRGSK
ncbi:MAG: PDZ domain-containing protein, partial [Planctomycetota bacterium]|nr:PDZ domain-containing protein [Planctomycetota bacterium]